MDDSLFGKIEEFVMDNGETKRPSEYLEWCYKQKGTTNYINAEVSKVNHIKRPKSVPFTLSRDDPNFYMDRDVVGFLTTSNNLATIPMERVKNPDYEWWILGRKGAELSFEVERGPDFELKWPFGYKRLHVRPFARMIKYR